MITMERPTRITAGNWRDKGNCRDEDPELFFSEDEERESKRKTRHELIAKQICDACPVSGFCLDAALAKGEYGVWGGTTWRERKQLNRRRPRVRCVRCRTDNIIPMEHGQVCIRCGLSWLI